jgi:hypothetical protein
MQLQAFMEEARIDAAEMLERVKKAAAELDKPLDLDISTLYRHARGKRYPSPDLQTIYQRASQDLIRAEDWLALHNNNSLGMPAKKRRKAEAAAQQEADAA